MSWGSFPVAGIVILGVVAWPALAWRATSGLCFWESIELSSVFSLDYSRTLVSNFVFLFPVTFQAGGFF